MVGVIPTLNENVFPTLSILQLLQSSLGFLQLLHRNGFHIGSLKEQVGHRAATTRFRQPHTAESAKCMVATIVVAVCLLSTTQVFPPARHSYTALDSTLSRQGFSAVVLVFNPPSWGKLLNCQTRKQSVGSQGRHTSLPVFAKQVASYSESRSTNPYTFRSTGPACR